MKKNLKTIVLLFTASILMLACNLASAGTNPAETPLAEEAAQAVEEIEPSAAPTLEPTPVPDMDLTSLVLTAADFPNVPFAAVTLEELGMSVSDLDSEEFSIESFFALLEPTNFEMVMGFTTLLQSPLNRAAFDLALNQPEILLKIVLGGMGDINTTAQEVLPEFNDTIGNSSAGMTVLTNMQGLNMRMDVVVFRHDSIGAFMITMYLDGQTPPVTLMDVASKFDEKIGAFLANQ